MEKKSPKTPKRKSLANANVTPNKVQKTGPSPNKNNRSPAVQNQKNQKTPQKNQKGKKQLNGRQNTPKPPKVALKTEEESDEENELEEESDEELVQNGIKAEPDSNDSDNEEEEDSDDEAEEGRNTNQKKTKPVQDPEERKFSAFLHGLPYTVTDGELKAFFSGCNILKVILLKHRDSKKPNGRAFVNFKDEASLNKALKKNDGTLKGRKISVKVAFNNEATSAIERKKRVLAALKRKVEVLEAEISQAETSPLKKQKSIK